jgi:Amt family ammonium transporter
LIQAKAVLVTLVWSGVVSLAAYKIADFAVGLRLADDEEREGLDTIEHGERSYNL